MASVTATNATSRYPRGKDQNKYKFTVSLRTSEKQRCILRSHKITSAFYTESTFFKPLCKPKDSVATEDKNNIVYEIDCSKCEALYFGKSKRSLKPRPDKRK